MDCVMGLLWFEVVPAGQVSQRDRVRTQGGSQGGAVRAAPPVMAPGTRSPGATDPGGTPSPGGLTLYEHSDFRGLSQTFTGDVPDLSRAVAVGNDAASSLRISPGCRAAVYEHVNFQGAAEMVDADLRNLDNTRVGNDRISSLRVSCQGGAVPDRQPPQSQFQSHNDAGVTLFLEENFRGRYEMVYNSDRDLSNNSIGDNQVRSIRVDPGCQVLLYEHPNYQGRYATLEQSVASLNRTNVGNDRLSSLRVICERPER